MFNSLLHPRVVTEVLVGVLPGTTVDIFVAVGVVVVIEVGTNLVVDSLINVVTGKWVTFIYSCKCMLTYWLRLVFLTR